MKVRIYHNPRCSKSRAALALLRERGLEIEVIHYLDNPPTATTLRQLVQKLGSPAATLLRTAEPEFRLYADRTLSDDEIIELLVQHPELLQRPIVEAATAARIGRPPANVLELFP